MSSSPDLYSAFRTNGGPTVYPEIKTAWQADILGSGLIFAFCILAVSFIVIIPGIRGKESVFTIVRVLTTLFIGAVILLTNFGFTWDTADISTHTKYKAGISNGIQADVGVYIGLRGINITLKGKPEHQLNETINYNEHFSWEGTQGRFGYGPYASRINQEYRAAQFRGLPQPILWIAEYFVFDEEGVRWGRFYRTAGFYSEILLWLSFALWLLANILFFLTLRYATYVLGLCGACMIGATLVWSKVRNPFELMIPFTDKDILKFSHGGSFWICMASGILSIVIAIVVWIVNWKSPLTAAAFFSIDAQWDQRKNENDHNGKLERPKQKNIQVEDLEDQRSGKKPRKVTRSFDGHVHNDWDSDVEYYSDDDLPPTDEENNDGDYSSSEDNDKDPNQCKEMITPRVTSYGLEISRSKAVTNIIPSMGTHTDTLLIGSPSNVSTGSSGIGSEDGSISSTSNASTRISVPISEGSSSVRETSSSKEGRSSGAGNVRSTRESTWFPFSKRQKGNTGVSVFDRHNQISPV
ncbi:hypothetical protein CHS0354_007293 [Potamilus streckersoni]|uniref:Dual oxidase maturation factor 1 n=1 Tax=Potamilus streckersoni TaxID=2493646 RepID=A0AAE0WCG5_9BIVA|nr:hypothetical protein CHS0354_007293 [Potamilus streckersoni]